MGRAVELANTIPNDGSRSQALARIAGMAPSTTLWVSAAHWRSRSLGNVLQAANDYLKLVPQPTHLLAALSANSAIMRVIGEFAALERRHIE